MLLKSTLNKWLHLTLCYYTGLVFTKGLRLSQVLGLNPVLKLRLLSQLSFVLKPYSQLSYVQDYQITTVCHVTFLFYSHETIGDIYPSFNAFYLRKSAVLKWKTLLPQINFSEVFCIIILYLQEFQILK